MQSKWHPKHWTCLDHARMSRCFSQPYSKLWPVPLLLTPLTCTIGTQKAYDMGTLNAEGHPIPAKGFERTYLNVGDTPEWISVR